MEGGLPPPAETPAERRRRLARERARRYREAHREELRDRSPLRRDERQRSQQRREAGSLTDQRDERQRSQQRREDGSHADQRDERQRSQQRREDGSLTDQRDERQRSQQRREDGSHADQRDERQRSQQRREDGSLTDQRDERQRSQQRREDGSHADQRDERQRSQQRREDGSHADQRDERQRSQQRREDGSHADNRRRDRSRAFFHPGAAPREQHPFVVAVSGLQYIRACNICHEIDILASTKISDSGNCSRCHREKTLPYKFSDGNGMVPDQVPPELRDLTFLEEMLISKVLPSIYACRLRGGGQYGYTNHAIAFPQDLENIATELPRAPSETGVLLIRKTGTNNTHRDYKVRQLKVAAALRWLKANNPYYIDVVISQTNMAALPEDGVPDDLPILEDDGDADGDQPEEVAGGGGDPAREVDPEDATVVTAVDATRPQPTEAEHIAHTLGPDATTPLEWPRRGDRPVNEYTQIGLFTMAFPALFPKASADITHVDPERPRTKKVDFGEWLAHLMSLEDGRFARHPRFRYYAWNMLQRKRATQTGRVFLKRDEEARNMTAEELQQILDAGNRSLEGQLQYFGSTLRGTPQWKNARRFELLDLIEELGMPTFFFTTSAADIHWPDLQLLMMRHEGAVVEDGNINSAGRNGRVVRNPHLVSAFFTRRCQLLIDEVVNGDGHLKNHWVIFEWQHRGSVHAHGLLWMDDCPVSGVEELLASEGREEEKQLLLDYYNTYISAWNPASIPVEDLLNYQRTSPNHPQLANPTIIVPPARQHPCQIRYGESDDPANDLSQLINTTNRHRSCSTTTCLKKKKGQLVCKAGFPQQLRAESEFVHDESQGVFKFAPARNDPILNAFPRHWMTLQRANMDIKPCLSQHALIRYLTKYCTKNEPSSDNLKSVTDKLLRQQPADAEPVGAGQAYMRTLISTVGNRDISAQEVTHHALQLRAILTSATFATATVNEREVTADGTIHKSAWRKYTERPATEPANGMNFVGYLKSHNLDTHRPRRRPAVPRIFPRLQVSGPEDDKFDRWCHHQLRVFKPCRSDDDLRPDPAVSWAAALRDWVHDGGAVPESVLGVLRGDQPQREGEEEEEEDSEEERIITEEGTQDDWILAGRDEQHLMDDAIDATGTDQADWHAYWHSMEGLAEDAEAFVKAAKGQHEVLFTPPDDALPERLNPEQRKAFDILRAATRVGTDPVRLLISGTAGSGKSFLIMCLRRCCLEEFGADSALYVRVCAPTGTAAFNIMGETLHRTLSLPVPITSELPQLAGEQLQALQTRLEGMRLLVIDEMSMVGRKLLRAVDLRLRQAFPHQADVPFGGISVCMLGDFGQLPPVMDRAMFDVTPGGGRLSEDGRASFREFTKAVVLKRVERVRGSDPAQERFRNLLSNVRNGAITQEDYRMLCTRLAAFQSAEELQRFADSPHLVASHDAEQNTNDSKLRELGRPCCTIKAVHQPARARKKSAKDAGGLEPAIRLCDGAKVMLRSNLWVAAGLTNGSLGTVVGVLYPPDSVGPDTLPAAVCVEFPGYQGPPWNLQRPKVVPVPPITIKWMEGTRLHSRTQIPLSLAFAVTIHKCQGWTRPTVSIDIGTTEFALGLTFVALSRSTSLRGILLNPADPASAQWSRFYSINTSKGQQKRQGADQLLERLHSST